MDLVQNLSTQAAIHRLLRSENKDESFEYLRILYQSVASEYFDGDVPFDQANSFLKALLLDMPSPRISHPTR